jgi:hypothetical protein
VDDPFTLYQAAPVLTHADTVTPQPPVLGEHVTVPLPPQLLPPLLLLDELLLDELLLDELLLDELLLVQIGSWAFWVVVMTC